MIYQFEININNTVHLILHRLIVSKKNNKHNILYKKNQLTLYYLHNLSCKNNEPTRFILISYGVIDYTIKEKSKIITESVIP